MGGNGKKSIPLPLACLDLSPETNVRLETALAMINYATAEVNFLASLFVVIGNYIEKNKVG